MNTPAIRTPLALVAALLVAAAPPTSAQDVARLMELPTEGRRLMVGSDHAGRIGKEDQRYDGKYVQAWELQLRSGQQVTVDHVSEDFDSYLMVVGPGLGQALTDDDGAGSLDSRITFQAPQAGRFLVIATTFGSGLTGAYTLRVAAGGALTGEAGRRQQLMEIPVQGRLEIGEIQMGRLQSGQASFEGKYAQAWTLDLMTGQEVTVDHVSEDFDSYLYVLGPGIQGILSDDDGAGDLDSRISFTASTTGRFYVVASSLSTGSTGAYALRVRSGQIGDQWELDQTQRRRFMEELPTQGRMLRIGQDHTGRLDAADPAYEGRHVQAWVLDLQAGQEITVDHLSEDFDSYLHVVGPGIEDVMTDDDGAGNLDSRLSFTAAASGRFKVIASALGTGDVGAYTLRVRAGRTTSQWEVEAEDLRRFMEELPTGGRTLMVGGESFGSLDEADARSPEGKYVEGWALDLQAGQEVTVDLMAEDFDCYLYVVGPGLGEMLSDDDGAGNLDSRIAFTASVSGRFKVIASSFGSDQTGGYTLQVLTGIIDTGYDEPSFDAVQAAVEALPYDGRRLTVGVVMGGYLSEEDAVGDLGFTAQAWALDLEAGEEVTIDLLSEDFDSFLMVMGPGIEEPLQNDDGAGDLDSRIAFVAPGTGTYRVVASSLGGHDTGGFTLDVRAGLEPEVVPDYQEDPYGGEDWDFLNSLPTEGRTLAIGGAAWGEVTSLDVVDASDRYVQAWALDLAGGQQVTVNLESDDFDAYLRVVGSDMEGLVDDDGGAGLNSRLAFTAPTTGRYHVVAGPLGAEATGAYTLRVASGIVDEHQVFLNGLSTMGSLTVGTERNGRLSQSDPVDPERGYVQVWTLRLNAGQRVSVDLISEDFDCYLFVSGPGLDAMLADDDDAGSLDSRITFTAPESATYRVAATSLSEGATGAYRLRVTAQ